MVRDEDVFAELAQLDHRVRRLEGGEQAGAPIAATWEELYGLIGEPVPDLGLGLRGVDLAAATIAGVGGGLLDLHRAIDAGLTSEGTHRSLDSAFKEKVREVTGSRGTVAIDNAMGGGERHRMVGPTHDLLRLFTAVRMVRSGKFLSAVMGVAKTKDAYRDGFPSYLQVDSASDALALVLLHWAADFFSSLSLPIPGWSKLAESEDREFVTSLFTAYREGANLRKLLSQFLSNLSGLALIGVVLHVYRYIDVFFITEREPLSIARLNLKDDLRYRWMARNANLTALAVSTANAAVTQNLFSWNYMAFFKFFADARAVERLLDVRNRELDERLEVLLTAIAPEAA